MAIYLNGQTPVSFVSLCCFHVIYLQKNYELQWDLNTDQ